MKESKIASFKNLSFGADFDGGRLVSLTVLPDKWQKDSGELVMDAAESSELSSWLLGVVGIAEPVRNLVQTAALKEYVSVATSAVNAATKGAAIPVDSLQNRTTTRISDAASVANRMPLEKALAADGMRLEEKQINPIEVRIEK